MDQNGVDCDHSTYIAIQAAKPVDNGIQLHVFRRGIVLMLTSVQSDLVLPAEISGARCQLRWLRGCASGSVKFPAYCRWVRFRVGWCRTNAVGPCAWQRVNSAGKGEIVDSGRRATDRIGTGASLMGRAEDGGSFPATSGRWRRAALPSCPHPFDSISAFCLTRPGLKASSLPRIYGAYDARSWQRRIFYKCISLFCIFFLLFIKFWLFAEM